MFHLRGVSLICVKNASTWALKLPPSQKIVYLKTGILNLLLRIWRCILIHILQYFLIHIPDYSPIDYPDILDILYSYYVSNQGKIFKFCWIPSHIGIHGNKEADKSAKSALEFVKFKIPSTDLKHFIKHL